MGFAEFVGEYFAKCSVTRVEQCVVDASEELSLKVHRELIGVNNIKYRFAPENSLDLNISNHTDLLVFLAK